MTSYTNASPGASLRVVISTSAGPQDSWSNRAASRRCSALGIPARWLSARGIPTVGGPTPPRRWTRDRFGRSGQGGAQTLKALHLEALLVRKFCDPWSVFSPSMASFLKRTANASFVPRLLSIGPSYVGQRLARSSRFQLRCRDR